MIIYWVPLKVTETIFFLMSGMTHQWHIVKSRKLESLKYFLPGLKWLHLLVSLNWVEHYLCCAKCLMEITSINYKFSSSKLAHVCLMPLTVTSEHRVGHNSKRGMAVILSAILTTTMLKQKYTSNNRGYWNHLTII